jgi:haloalkane dehalogenase
MGNVPAEETFGGTYPFKPNYRSVNGHRMHYIDEGEGDPIVLIHGFPMWSYLYRNYVPELAKQNRVIVPDHLGYGKSDSPEGVDYTFSGHGANLEQLLLDLDLEDVTLVLHDIGGPIGARYAFRHHARIKRIVLQNTVFFGMDPAFEIQVMAGGIDNTPPYLAWIAQKHSEGDFLTLYNNIDATLPGLINGLPLVWKAPLSFEATRAYMAPFANKEHAAAARDMARLVYAPLVEGKGISGYYPPTDEEVAAIKQKPALFICGMQDRAVTPGAFLKIFAHQFADAPIVELPDTGHFVQEDSHEAIVALIKLFMQLADR